MVIEASEALQRAPYQALESRESIGRLHESIDRRQVHDRQLACATTSRR